MSLLQLLEDYREDGESTDTGPEEDDGIPEDIHGESGPDNEEPGAGDSKGGQHQSVLDAWLVDGVPSPSPGSPLPDNPVPGPSGLHRSPEECDPIVVPKERSDFRRIVDRMASQFRDTTRRYMSDVFQSRNPREAEKVSRIIRAESERQNSRRFIIIRQHESHVHVVHLCTYSSSHCRCAFIEKAKAVADFRMSPGGIRRRLAIRLSKTDCTSILLYFLPKPGTTDYHHIVINGSVEGYVLRAEDMEEPGHMSDSNDEGEHSLEACQRHDQAELLTPEQRRLPIKEVRASRLQGSLKSGGSRKEKFQKQILTMCKTYCMSPVKAIFNHTKWLTDETLQFVRPDNKIAQSVLDTFSQLIVNWTMHDFYRMYTAPEASPCFIASNNQPDEYYYNIPYSVTILNSLLLFQFGSEEPIRDFLKLLYNVVEKKAGKTNSILVYSPPSAGKNFFFDTLLSFLLNKGQLGNPNKHNHFAYQECPGKRILLWNEPNYESSQEDMLKMVLGGDNYTVNVKCQKDVAVAKTPVILLTNRLIRIMSAPAFVDRIKVYHWRAAAFLKEYNKKPHPMSIYILMEKYKVF